MVAFAAAALVAMVGLLGAVPASAASAESTYDTAAYTYDATAGSSGPHAATTYACGSPGEPGAAGLVSADSACGFVLAAETGTSVFPTTRLGAGRSELENGLDPARFAAGDQSAYVGDEAAARTLAHPNVGSYENGYTRFDMHPGFDGEFSKFKYNYPEGGPGSYEYQIPQSMIPRFNELTINRTWTSFQ